MIQQTLFETPIYTLPVRVSNKVYISDINKIVRPSSTLNCTARLIDPEGRDVVSCKECVKRGISSPVSYIVWRIVPSVNRYHCFEYDVMLLCCGTENHTHEGKYRFVLNVL